MEKQQTEGAERAYHLGARGPASSTRHRRTKAEISAAAARASRFTACDNCRHYMAGHGPTGCVAGVPSPAGLIRCGCSAQTPMVPAQMPLNTAGRWEDWG